MHPHTQLCFDGFYCILLVFVGFGYSKLGVYGSNFESYMLLNVHMYNEISNICENCGAGKGGGVELGCATTTTTKILRSEL